jgi:peptidoglycan/LPS O-acetylase OafA/YrhL
MAQSNRIEQLTFPRFISAFIIMVAHTKPSWFVDDAWFNPLFHGFFAVTFFFVLSGFVLGLSYHDKFEDDKAGDLKKYFIIKDSEDLSNLCLSYTRIDGGRLSLPR